MRCWSGGAEGRAGVYTDSTNAESPPGVTMSTSIQLHLPDLVIQGFRGINDLTISRLGRVTLLAGRNSVGKTTVLEAVHAYAARGRPGVLEQILEAHQETATTINEEGEEVVGPDLLALFHRRRSSDRIEAVIGSASSDVRLRLCVAPLSAQQEEEIWRWVPDPLVREFVADNPGALRAEFDNRSAIVGIGAGLTAGAPPQLLPGSARTWRFGPRRPGGRRALLPGDEVLPTPIVCERVGPGLPNNGTMAHYFDAIALTADQESAVNALRLIFGDQVENIAFVGRDRGPRGGWLRPIVKLSSYDEPVPLRSLGDGALRLLGIALSLANSRDGFLLIDEAENGIHHSLQRNFWRMVLQTAQRNDVQVIATTHSWDCVTGFAKAVCDLPDVDGLLVRLERSRGRLRAVEYTEEELQTAAKHGIEVR